MANSLTTTTTTSYGARIKGALLGIVVGPIIIFIACGFLWRNEASNAHTIDALNEGKSAVQEANIASVDTQLQGKLVHLSGVASTKDILKDPDFSLAVPAIRLERKVETYQWKEHKKEKSNDKYGGSQTTTTTYTYDTVWDDSIISSSHFHEKIGHENPITLKYQPLNILSETVAVGAYTLSSPMINQIPIERTLNLSEYTPQMHTGEILVGNMIYVGNDPQSPQVGDTRISYTIANNNLTLSILGKQSGSNSIESYIAKSGIDISRVETGTKSASEMFQSADDENSRMTWIIRIAGLFFIFIGFSLFFRIFPILAKIIPPLAWFIDAGVFLVALILMLILGGGIIITAWFIYRPVLSLLLLFALGILIAGTYSLMHTKAKQVSISNIPPTLE